MLKGHYFLLNILRTHFLMASALPRFKFFKELGRRARHVARVPTNELLAALQAVF